jgi:hypothetical protein
VPSKTRDRGLIPSRAPKLPGTDLFMLDRLVLEIFLMKGFEKVFTEKVLVCSWFNPLTSNALR